MSSKEGITGKRVSPDVAQVYLLVQEKKSFAYDCLILWEDEIGNKETSQKLQAFEAH